MASDDCLPVSVAAIAVPCAIGPLLLVALAALVWHRWSSKRMALRHHELQLPTQERLHSPAAVGAAASSRRGKSKSFMASLVRTGLRP